MTKEECAVLTGSAAGHDNGQRGKDHNDDPWSSLIQAMTGLPPLKEATPFIITTKWGVGNSDILAERSDHMVARAATDQAKVRARMPHAVHAGVDT